MGTASAEGWRQRLTPGVAVAAAAGGAGLACACLALLLWRAAPSLLVPALLLSPLPVAAGAWLAARHAIRAALAPSVAAAQRLAAADFSPAMTDAGPEETRALSDALESCRAHLAARERTMRAHAAMAKLMGAGVGRLARGDLSARITVELPAPYDGFARDFDAIVERLAAGAETAGALDEAAARLEARARRLEARLEADRRVIAALAGRDPAEALAVARHMMEGVGVATSRNIEAAQEFALLARTLGAKNETGDGRLTRAA